MPLDYYFAYILLKSLQEILLCTHLTQRTLALVILSIKTCIKVLRKVDRCGLQIRTALLQQIEQCARNSFKKQLQQSYWKENFNDSSPNNINILQCKPCMYISIRTVYQSVKDFIGLMHIILCSIFTQNRCIFT